MHTESGRVIAHAIASVGTNDLPLFSGVDAPDEADSLELADLLSEHTRGMRRGDAVGDALAIGILAGREIERTRALCDHAC